MKLLSVLLVLVILYSCTDNTKPIKYYYVEDYRKPGMNDWQVITAALNDIPDSSNLKYADTTYTLSHTLFVFKTIHFFGKATLKREDQINFTLKEKAYDTSKYIILNDVTGMQEADRLIVSLDANWKHSTGLKTAIRISGDTLFLNGTLGRTTANESIYPVGTSVFKNIYFFWVISPNKYPDMSCSFDSMTFDGNRDNNKGSHYWDLNAAVVALTKGTTYYRNCLIKNSPNESLVGHNADIRNCVFTNLNGSGYHTSADKQNMAESEIHSFVIDNRFENTNQINDTTNGHSEGAITHSNSGGYYTATGNTFINVGESVLGALYSSNHASDWGTSNITFTGNTINGAGRMVYLIDTTLAKTMHNVKISGNTISNMPERDFSKELSHFGSDIVIEQK